MKSLQELLYHFTDYHLSVDVELIRHSQYWQVNNHEEAYDPFF